MAPELSSPRSSTSSWWKRFLNEKFRGLCKSMENVQEGELMRLQPENCRSIQVIMLCSKYLVFNALTLTGSLFFLAFQLKFIGCFLHIFFKSACIFHIFEKILAIIFHVKWTESMVFCPKLLSYEAGHFSWMKLRPTLSVLTAFLIIPHS